MKWPPKLAAVTQDSHNDIMGLMSFNWEEILTCRSNCIWLKTILVLLLANWLGRVGERVLEGSMVSLWKYPKCPLNGDEEKDQKHERRQSQLKKHSTCSDMVSRGRGEGIRGAGLKVKNWSRTTVTSTALEDSVNNGKKTTTCDSITHTLPYDCSICFLTVQTLTSQKLNW